MKFNIKQNVNHSKLGLWEWELFLTICCWSAIVMMFSLVEFALMVNAANPDIWLTQSRKDKLAFLANKIIGDANLSAASTLREINGIGARSFETTNGRVRFFFPVAVRKFAIYESDGTEVRPVFIPSTERISPTR